MQLANPTDTPPQVLDLNDQRPTSPATSVTLRVREGVRVGEEVGVVIAGDNGRFTYTIHSGNTGGTFDIDRTSGQVGRWSFICSD